VLGKKKNGRRGALVWLGRLITQVHTCCARKDTLELFPLVMR